MGAGNLAACRPLYLVFGQDSDLPPLQESVLRGKFDPDEAPEEAGKGPAEGESPGEYTPPVMRARDLRLKGADAVVYMCAARLGLRPMVLRIVWDESNKVSMRVIVFMFFFGSFRFDWGSLKGFASNARQIGCLFVCLYYGRLGGGHHWLPCFAAELCCSIVVCRPRGRLVRYSVLL